MAQVVYHPALLLFSEIGAGWQANAGLEKARGYIRLGMVRKIGRPFEQGLEVHGLPDGPGFDQMPLQRLHDLLATSVRIRSSQGEASEPPGGMVALRLGHPLDYGRSESASA